jgi:hypothetical protein
MPAWQQAFWLDVLLMADPDAAALWEEMALLAEWLSHP